MVRFEGVAQIEAGGSTTTPNECDTVEQTTWREAVRCQGEFLFALVGVAVLSAVTEQRRGTRFDLGDRSWQDQANCLGVDPDLFFPERGASTREAKGVCRGCVVREDCLEYALVNGEKFGIWGGLAERERSRIRRQRMRARGPGGTASV